MRNFNIRTYSFATVTARDEQHAREILSKLANKAGQINLSQNLPMDEGGVFGILTIDVEGVPLEDAGEVY